MLFCDLVQSNLGCYESSFGSKTTRLPPPPSFQSNSWGKATLVQVIRFFHEFIENKPTHVAFSKTFGSCCRRFRIPAITHILCCHIGCGCDFTQIYLLSSDMFQLRSQVHGNVLRVRQPLSSGTRALPARRQVQHHRQGRRHRRRVPVCHR